MPNRAAIYAGLHSRGRAREYNIKLTGEPSRWRADLALVFCTFIWGSTFVIVKEALNDASTLLFLALRFTVAAIALAAIFRPLPSKFVRPGALIAGGAGAGCLMFAGYLLQTMGLRYTSPSKSAFITGLSIALVPVMAAIFDRKALRRGEVLGLGVATAGLVLLTLPAGSFRVEYGDLLTIGCAVAFAAHIIAVGHFVPKLGFQALTLSQIAVSAALALGAFWWAEPVKVRWTPALFAAVAITGLFATALAFSIQAWAQQRTSPTHTALIFSMEPVFASLTAIAVEGQWLSGRAAVGAALIFAGIIAVELKPSNPGRIL